MPDCRHTPPGTLSRTRCTPGHRPRCLRPRPDLAARRSSAALRWPQGSEQARALAYPAAVLAAMLAAGPRLESAPALVPGTAPKQTATPARTRTTLPPPNCRLPYSHLYHPPTDKRACC